MNRIEELVADLRRRVDRLAESAERRPQARAAVYTGPVGSTGRLRFAKVATSGLKNLENAAWVDFDTDGYRFLSHVLAHPCAADGTGEDTSTDLYLKATEDPAAAPTGYEQVAVADVVGYLPGDGKEAVPGTSGPVIYFNGYLVPNAGDQGAVMTARVVD
jgi:hypothetical protein